MTSKTILEVFGKNLRKLRKEKGFSSQIEFALKAKIDRTYIGGIERGERNISLLNIEKIAKTLKISISELFKGINRKN